MVGFDAEEESEKMRGLEQAQQEGLFGSNDRESCLNSTKIRALLNNALTDKINDREIFMKGIDYSYYYESDDSAMEPDDSDSKSN